MSLHNVEEFLLSGEAVSDFHECAVTLEQLRYPESIPVLLPDSVQNNVFKDLGNFWNVIGPDDRIDATTISPPQPEFWKICHLRITSAGGKINYGTGWIAGPRTVITAGHCVYNKHEGSPVASIEVYPARNGTQFPFGGVLSNRVGTTRGYIEGGQDTDLLYDYGAVFLPQPVDHLIGAFNYLPAPDDILKNSLLHLSGYPREKDNQEFGKQWYSNSKWTDPIYPAIFGHEIDATASQSGSPIWINTPKGAIVVGMHIRSANMNIALRINPSVVQNLDSWSGKG